jgi:hypothetical protein
MDTSIGLGLIILNFITGIVIIGALGYICILVIKGWPEK